MKTALTLSGSIRTGSYNQKLQRIVSDKLSQAGVAVNALNLGDYPMPIFNEDLEPDNIPEAAIQLAQLWREADIIFIASPEYNGSHTPLLVNTLAWLSRQSPSPFRHATFGIGGVSSGKYGALWSLSHLRESLTKVGALVVPTLLGIGPASQAFDEEGNLTEAGVIKKIDTMVSELTHFNRG